MGSRVMKINRPILIRCKQARTKKKELKSHVEYAFKAITNEGLTSVALKGTSCAVVVSQRRITDKLVDAKTVTSLFRITEQIGLMATGAAPDARAMVARAREEAAEFRYQYGYPITVDLLGRRLANLNQLCTQQAAMRPYGVAVTLIGMDVADDGSVLPQLYKCDPAGFYIGYSGTATGPKAADIVTSLEKKALPIETPDHVVPSSYHFGDTLDTTLDCAIKTLADTLGQEFKAADLEIGVVTRENTAFRTLPTEAIDAILTRLAESD
jgi:20S proteasome subunit alpha 1